MNVIVTAGGEIQPKHPLYAVSHGGLKAMMDVVGKPMVQWVLDALGKSDNVDRVVVVGLPPETSLDCARPLTLLPDEGDMFSNVRAGAREMMQSAPGESHVLLASADIPTLRSEIVDWLICQCQDQEQDIYYTVIERGTMDRQFPGARRSYTRLKDLELCGGDLHCFRLAAAMEDGPAWKRLHAARKGPLRQASLLGYDTLFFLMLRQLNLKAAEESISKRLGLQGRAVLSPYAEIGMDVDKPAELDIVSDYLSKEHAKHLSGAA